MKMHTSQARDLPTATQRLRDQEKPLAAAQFLRAPGQHSPINDQRKQSTLLHQLQAYADQSQQVAHLHGVQRKMTEKKDPNTAPKWAAVVQRLTEVINESKDQKYLAQDGEVKSQQIGVEMDAYLDPWQPLHGTESSAFTRHGIYLDPSYAEDQKNDESKGATAMHLLNANLGGLAVDENLFPGHTNLNGQHLKQIESYVKVNLIELAELTQNNKNAGIRVHYHVEINPPDTLKPEDMKKSYLSFNQPRFVDHNGNVGTYNGLIKLREDPDADLKKIGWSVGKKKGNTKRTERELLDPRNKRKDATFGETVSDANDPKNKEAYRLHFFRGNDWNDPIETD